MRCLLLAEYVYPIPSFHCEDRISQIPKETYSGLGMAGFTVFAFPTIFQLQFFLLSRVFIWIFHVEFTFSVFFGQKWLPQSYPPLPNSFITRLILQESSHHLVLHVHPPLIAPHHPEDKSIAHGAKLSPTRSLPAGLIWAFPSGQCAFLRRGPPFSPIQILPLKMCSNPTSHMKTVSHLPQNPVSALLLLDTHSEWAPSRSTCLIFTNISEGLPLSWV